MANIQFFQTLSSQDVLVYNIPKMNPNYPTLTPPIGNPIWFDVDAAFDEETEVNLLAGDYQDQVRSTSLKTAK